MTRYQAPGVYYERVDATVPAVSALRTDVAAFVGIAVRGPCHQPVVVESWRQFQTHFGGFTGAGQLAYSVRGFFENGGLRCWVVRVASEWATAASVTLSGPAGISWRVEASSAGVWGNDLDVAAREVRRAQTLSDPSRSLPEVLGVASTTGFETGQLVRLSQDGSTTQYRVLRHVDPVGRNLVLWHEDPSVRTPYDLPLSGVDLGRPLLIESLSYTLLVRQRGRLLRSYDNLSTVPEHLRYAPVVLAGPGKRAPDAPAVNPPAEPIVVAELREIGPATRDPLQVDGLWLPLRGGADGLARLSVRDFVGEAISASDGDELRVQKLRGIRTLEAIGEVSLLLAPDIHVRPAPPVLLAPLPPCPEDACRPGTPSAPVRVSDAGDLPRPFVDEDVFAVQQAMVEQCERLRDRVALLDAPHSAAGDPRLGISAVTAWRSRFDSQYAALAFPWVKVKEISGAREITRALPASGHLAGVCAATDLREGVHRAPANVPLVWAEDVTVPMGEEEHGMLNAMGVNVIRPTPGRGIRILGARTLSSDPDGRYLNVRRLLIMIKKAIDVSIQWATFEPNDVLTRAKLQLVLTSFLLGLWQRGALTGARQEQAFFVKCDLENNPPALHETGQLIVDIGVAPSIPFEFVVLRVGRTDNEFQITDATPGLSGRGTR